MDARFVRWIYVLLSGIWLTAVLWQLQAGRDAQVGLRSDLQDRAEDISQAIAVAIRAEGRFNAVPQRRVEAMLDELTASTNLRSVSLRDVDGAVTAKSGTDPAISLDDAGDKNAYWLPESAVFVTFVALAPLPGDRDAFGGGHDRGRDRGRDGGPDVLWPPIPPTIMMRIEPLMNGTPLTDEDIDRFLSQLPGPVVDDRLRSEVQKTLVGQVLTRESLPALHAALMESADRRLLKGSGRSARWRDLDHGFLLDKRGINAFVLEVPATETYAAIEQDRKTRLLLIGLLSLVCLVIGYLLHTLRKSATLGMQLARSEAMTIHLQELNVAAAGLVHETKNPLNLIRGQAQMIEREERSDARSRATALKIVEEADRVAGRLNQFLDYSRPLNPNKKQVHLGPMLADLFSLLDSDREEKSIKMTMYVEEVPNVWADADMLRQVLFNLLLNAIEAVPEKGYIEVVAGCEKEGGAWLEVRDDGPGVAPELRDTLFQPYVTGTATGTGLGLTIVRQIALAHGWELSCNTDQPEGAEFRIARITVKS